MGDDRSAPDGRRVETHSEAETQRLGREFATSLAPCSVILLSGELGAGKTAFVRGMAEGLGVPPSEVTSPTFTIIQEYRGGRLCVYHVDLYRLTPVEVDDLGLDDLVAEGGVTAIEWPERLPRPIEHAIRVDLRHVDDSIRSITIASAS
jgi:tRNA threonylcarbamoyladenosine biosynthesis protein TsaE